MRLIVPTTVIAFVVVASAWGAGSGVRVTVTSSPTCPVETIPPQPGCAPRPVDARIRVTASGKTVARARTGSDGKVSIPLRAGRYRVYARPASGGSLPRCPSATAVVHRGRYAKARIDCDSGIR
jgi:hypothetical protein